MDRELVPILDRRETTVIVVHIDGSIGRALVALSRTRRTKQTMIDTVMVH